MDHRPAGPMPGRAASPPPLPPLFVPEGRHNATAPPDTGADDAVRRRIEMLIREWRF